MHPIQRQILELTGEYDISGMSLREIGALLGEDHPQKVKHHIEQLKKRGFLNRDPKNLNRVNSWQEVSANIVAVPIIGSANAGPANVFAEENFEGFLQVSAKLLKKQQNVFAVEAVGNSLNRADIDGRSVEDGDYLIVTPVEGKPNNGDYVLSVIDGFANVKRFVEDQQNSQIVLMSESSYDYPPIYIHPEDFSSYFVNGVIIQVIKTPKPIV